MNKDFLKQAKEFLISLNAKILEDSSEGPLTPLHKVKLEEIPKRPHLFIEWKRIKLLVFISNKDELFSSNDGNLKTGGDWSIFQFLYHIELKTGIDIALLIHEKETDSWFFRQLNQLSKPELNWRDRCLAFQFKRKSEYWNCAKCWKRNPQTCERCMNQKQPTALWNSKEFSDKIIIQKHLL